jgi:UDP-4-amino-4-deoxy-L-arabinose formyltransferase/UDP-glucuronic acid dehydrogenase (UDP-4-keto-hexauronic acid decarboxylating)
VDDAAVAVTQRLRVALIAEEAAGVRCLRCIVDAGHEVVVVFAATELRGGPGVAAAAASRAGLPVRAPAEVRTAAVAELLRDLGVDLLLNVHGLHVVHPAVLAAPRLGAFNLHPGPLPEYAGLNAPSWAILNGEQRHGVTLHWMEPEIDAGPIAYAASFPLGPRETGLSASLACVTHGIPLIARLLATAATDAAAIPALPQDDGRVRRYHDRSAPYGGGVPWHESGRRIEALVRAADYHPFPSPWGAPTTRLGDRALRVLRARATTVSSQAAPGTVVEVRADAALVATADGCVAFERLEVDGRVTDPSSLLRAGDRLDALPV